MKKPQSYTVVPTGNPENPFCATSSDNLNVAYGQTEKLAVKHLLEGIENRNIYKN